MALITCPECGKQISDQAASCPNCGKPLKSKMVEQHLQAMMAEQEYMKYTLRTARKVLCILASLLIVGYVMSVPSFNSWEALMEVLFIAGTIVGFAKPDEKVAALSVGILYILGGIVGILCHGNGLSNATMAFCMIPFGIVFAVCYWRMKAYD